VPQPLAVAQPFQAAMPAFLRAFFNSADKEFDAVKRPAMAALGRSRACASSYVAGGSYSD
jgi:hypothetical protein